MSECIDFFVLCLYPQDCEDNILRYKLIYQNNCYDPRADELCESGENNLTSFHIFIFWHTEFTFQRTISKFIRDCALAGQIQAWKKFHLMEGSSTSKLIAFLLLIVPPSCRDSPHITVSRLVVARNGKSSQLRPFSQWQKCQRAWRQVPTFHRLWKGQNWEPWRAEGVSK